MSFSRRREGIHHLAEDALALARRDGCFPLENVKHRLRHSSAEDIAPLDGPHTARDHETVGGLLVWLGAAAEALDLKVFDRRPFDVAVSYVAKRRRHRRHPGASSKTLCNKW